jgi:hypothetical protein
LKVVPFLLKQRTKTELVAGLVAESAIEENGNEGVGVIHEVDVKL